MKNKLILIIILAIVFVLLGCTMPDRKDFDIPESFDRAMCSYYNKDRKLFGEKKESKECISEAVSLADARREARAYARLKSCASNYKSKGFETQRECVLYLNQK